MGPRVREDDVEMVEAIACSAIRPTPRVVPAKAGTHNHGRQCEAQALNQQITEITPFEVLALDQLDLPVPLPPFQLLLAGDRFVRAVIGFDIDQTVNALGLNKRRAVTVSMLCQPLLQGIGHPDVQGPVTPARENVDVVHARNTEWMLSLSCLITR